MKKQMMARLTMSHWAARRLWWLQKNFAQNASLQAEMDPCCGFSDCSFRIVVYLIAFLTPFFFQLYSIIQFGSYLYSHIRFWFSKMIFLVLFATRWKLNVNSPLSVLDLSWECFLICVAFISSFWLFNFSCKLIRIVQVLNWKLVSNWDCFN